ncbi:IS4 family transposase [Mesorhizobium sp. M0306]|uniref:IS4 family transposase n=1 Tax=unclassified Mesorhizobium TaxID=325217 RepID=UPI00333A585E
MPLIHSALIETLGWHFALSKSRLVTLAALIAGLAQSRSVNLSHLAVHLCGPACHASKYRRLQRFFQFVRLDQAVAARLVVHMLNLERPKYLALDRTNWKLGSRDINILMLAIVTRHFRVPLLFALLPHQANSDTGHRIALPRRYLSLFPAASIRCLLADREFIGAECMDFLNENNIPFAIRVKVDMTVTLEDGRAWSLATLLRRRRARCATLVGHINGTVGATREPLRLAAKRLGNGEWLIVATNRPDPKQPLNDYRKRWGIECLFGDTKTRGLNLEDTHITNPEKLASLIVVVMLAITWAYRCATQTHGMKAIPRKSHGRLEKSWFRIGLDALEELDTQQPQSSCPCMAR